MQAQNIKVYGFVSYDRSGKVRWTLEELGLPFEYVSLDYEKGEAKTPEHLKRHPLGRVPVLEMDGITMFESVAICWYLAERFPTGNLLPDLGTPKRAECLQWTYFSEATLDAAKTYRAAFKALPDYPADAKTPEGKLSQEVFLQNKKEADDEFNLVLGVINKRLETGEYLCGRFTIADITLAYSLGWTYKRGGLADYPALRSYIERNMQRPAAVKSGVFSAK
jgi:glutathione S-transferase